MCSPYLPSQHAPWGLHKHLPRTGQWGRGEGNNIVAKSAVPGPQGVDTQFPDWGGTPGLGLGGESSLNVPGETGEWPVYYPGCRPGVPSKTGCRLGSGRPSRPLKYTM